MGHVINAMCYKGTILQRNYRKMSISCYDQIARPTILSFKGLILQKRQSIVMVFAFCMLSNVG